MEKITRERVVAREMVEACRGDIREALERMERARDLFFNACALGKVAKCESIIKEIRKGAFYV